MKIKELIAAAKDDEKVTLTGSQLRSLDDEVRTEITEEVTRTVQEEADRKYADKVRTDLPEPMRGELLHSDVRVGHTRSPYEAYTDDTRAVGAGLVLRAFAAAEGNWPKAQETIRAWVKEVPTPEGEQVVRTLTEGDFDSAGSFVQTQYSNEIIQLLRNTTVIRQAGARVIPVPGGNLTMHRITGGSSAYYRGEGQTVTPSGMNSGQLTLSVKELIARVAISNRLLRHASPAVDVIARNDMVATMGEKEDLTFIRSVGGQYTPKGLRYLAHSSHIVGAVNTASPTLVQVRADLAKPTLALKRANIGRRQAAWLMSHRTEEFLMQVVDTSGNPVYEAEMQKGLLRGIPYFATNQIPENLGTGGDESELYLVDFSEIFIGEDGQMEMRVDKDVAYTVDGQLRSAYDVDETVIQVNQFHDFGTRYDKAIYVLTGLKWAL